jgi:flavodoxin I
MARLISPAPDVFDLVDGFEIPLQDYELVILGTPTYGQGELHHPWISFLPRLRSVHWAGRTLALFALGDQRFHGKTFAGGLHELHRGVSELESSVSGR